MPVLIHDLTPDKYKLNGVYMILNKVNQKKYVGSSAQGFKNRWWQHKTLLRSNKHSNTYLQNSWNKYGQDSFEFLILEICKNTNDCLDMEQYWMDYYKVCDRSLGYNRRPKSGSNLGVKFGPHTDEHKAKISAGQTRKPGEYHHSDETKKIISEKGRGVKRSDEFKEKARRYHTGKKRSLECRLAISAAMKGKGRGRKLSESHKKAISDSLRGRKVNIIKPVVDETKRKFFVSTILYWQRERSCQL